MSKDTEVRYQEIVKDLDKNEELKKKVSSYLDEEDSLNTEDKIEFISVTEAARRHGFTYITMLKTCMKWAFQQGMDDKITRAKTNLIAS